MALMHGESVTQVIEEVVGADGLSHLSSFAIEMLTPNGGSDIAPADIYPEQMRAYYSGATHLGQTAIQ